MRSARGALAGVGRAPLEIRVHAQHVQRVQRVDQRGADAPEAVAPLRGQRHELIRAPGVALVGPPGMLEGLRQAARPVLDFKQNTRMCARACSGQSLRVPKLGWASSWELSWDVATLSGAPPSPPPGGKPTGQPQCLSAPAALCATPTQMRKLTAALPPACTIVSQLHYLCSAAGHTIEWSEY